MLAFKTEKQDISSDLFNILTLGLDRVLDNNKIQTEIHNIEKVDKKTILLKTLRKEYVIIIKRA